MTRVIRLCMLVVATAPMWSTDAGASTRTTDESGDACQAQNQGDNVGWTEFGFANRCGNCTKIAFCPLTIMRDNDANVTVTISSIEAHVFDSNAATNDFFCIPMLHDMFGGVVVATSKFTTPGTNPNEQPLFWSDPFMGVNIGTSPRSVFVECSIPAVGTNGESAVESLRMVANFQ